MLEMLMCILHCVHVCSVCVEFVEGTKHYMTIHLEQVRCPDSTGYSTLHSEHSHVRMLTLRPSKTSPSLLLSIAITQTIHAGNHWEQYGYFISESYGKPQGRNYLRLSAFLLLHDGCLMSTWTCGNA